MKCKANENKNNNNLQLYIKKYLLFADRVYKTQFAAINRMPLSMSVIECHEIESTGANFTAMHCQSGKKVNKNFIY